MSSYKSIVFITVFYTICKWRLDIENKKEHTLINSYKYTPIIYDKNNYKPSKLTYITKLFINPKMLTTTFMGGGQNGFLELLAFAKVFIYYYNNYHINLFNEIILCSGTSVGALISALIACKTHVMSQITLSDVSNIFSYIKFITTGESKVTLSDQTRQIIQNEINNETLCQSEIFEYIHTELTPHEQILMKIISKNGNLIQQQIINKYSEIKFAKKERLLMKYVFTSDVKTTLKSIITLCKSSVIQVIPDPRINIIKDKLLFLKNNIQDDELLEIINMFINDTLTKDDDFIKNIKIICEFIDEDVVTLNDIDKYELMKISINSQDINFKLTWKEFFSTYIDYDEIPILNKLNTKQKCILQTLLNYNSQYKLILESRNENILLLFQNDIVNDKKNILERYLHTQKIKNFVGDGSLNLSLDVLYLVFMINKSIQLLNIFDISILRKLKTLNGLISPKYNILPLLKFTNTYLNIDLLSTNLNTELCMFSFDISHKETSLFERKVMFTSLQKYIDFLSDNQTNSNSNNNISNNNHNNHNNHYNHNIQSTLDKCLIRNVGINSAGSGIDDVTSNVGELCSYSMMAPGLFSRTNNFIDGGVWINNPSVNTLYISNCFINDILKYTFFDKSKNSLISFMWKPSSIPRLFYPKHAGLLHVLTTYLKIRISTPTHLNAFYANVLYDDNVMNIIINSPKFAFSNNKLLIDEWFSIIKSSNLTYLNII